MEQTNQLLTRLQQCDSLAIVNHANPDPDCIASALALEEIASSEGVSNTKLLYCGEVSHQQNRAFINLLNIPLHHPSAVPSISEYSSLALVDHSQLDPEFPHPSEFSIEIIIDHHAVSDTSDAGFVDRRPDYGATATIVIDYLKELNLDPSTTVASALLFALHRERLDHARSPTIREYNAASFIHPYVDSELIDQLYSAAYTPATLDAISEAIRRREVRGSRLVTSVGRTTEADALPQAADYLLHLEGVDTVLVEGVVEDTVRLSARSIDPQLHLGEVLADAFDDVGSAGGHRDMAGAQIPLGIFGDTLSDDGPLYDLLFTNIAERFFTALHPNGV
ncbi:DHH family phosphoesterase [Halocatena salina]|uniref:Bifunctional oligoribonuclease/PAP phosphatase NrnA n=1 Tax=Halocatena salina TaxID=2934340 RepID=A0A8U0A767_9EURY|nr:bifunctional oligoribonuclease/PAP phosphatase NrnA [Halocatena salina]UPM44699.1 bifunctional oligoribonuclease/PAP phosphatase NrnA [Halocatena salina]